MTVTAITGMVTFGLGFFIGQTTFQALLRRQRKKISRERGAINAVWRYLYRHHGIERPDWIARIADRQEDDTETVDRFWWQFRKRK